MKNCIKIVLIKILLPTILFAQNWQQLPMHGGGYVTGLIHHPTQNNTLFARIDVGGIYKTDNGGDTWISLTKDLIKDNKRNYQVRSFVIDENNPQNLFFVSGNSPYSSDATFWKSTDGGINWQRETCPTKIGGNHLARYAGETLAISPDNPLHLYLAGQPTYDWATSTWQANGGLYRRGDGTGTWTRLDGNTFDRTWITAIRFHPNDPDLLYIAAVVNQQWGSATENEGLWSYRISTGVFTHLRTEEVMDFDFDASQPDTIITTQQGGISWTYDAGTTWSALIQPYGYSSYSYFVTAHPHQSGHWFFGYWNGFNANGILETIDSGASFVDVKYNTGTNSNLIHYPIYAATNQQPGFGNAPATLLFSPLNSNVAYVSDWYGVWRSDDASLNLANNPSSPSTDNANWQWTYKTQGIYNLVNLRISRKGTGFYCNVADVGGYYSDDKGMTMQHFTGFPVTSIYKMQFEGDTGYCVGKHHSNKGRIVKTTDGGNSWYEAATGGQYNMSYFELNNASCITDLQLLAGSPDTLIVAIAQGSMAGQIYRSDDGGFSYYTWDEGFIATNAFKEWTPLDKLIRDADGRTFYAFHQNQAYKRHIDDATWTALPNPMGAGWFAQIVAHPTIPNELYATQYGNGIFKSTDGGATWSALPSGGMRCTAIAVIAGRLAVVDDYLSSTAKPQSVFYTDDEGLNWVEVGMNGFYSVLNGIEFLDEEHLLGWSENTGAAILQLPTFLPVELLSFQAFCENNEVVLAWETASEMNNLGWEIQYSFDGVQFEKLTFVEGKGTNANGYSYYFVSKFENKTNFIRLKQIDLNENFEYSNVLTIPPCNAATWEVYSTNGGIFIQTSQDNWRAGEWQATVFDLEGRVVFSPQNMNTATLLIQNQNITKGKTYILTLTNGQKCWSQKIFIR